MHLDAQLISVAELSAATLDPMFTLMQRHFDNMQRGAFERDLEEKDWVILLRDPATRQLAGFSTQMLLEVDVAGRRVRALFSGDTIIDRDHWGDNTLPHVWGRFALSLVHQFPDAELYWFLISKGYRTYRYLPLFFREFYPRYDRTTPSRTQTVLDALAGEKFPRAYDSRDGIVRGGAAHERLRAPFSEVPARQRSDPHVNFFLEKNPGYIRGDELCCLAPLTRENFTAAGLRVIHRAQHSENMPS